MWLDIDILAFMHLTAVILEAIAFYFALILARQPIFKDSFQTNGW